jgi:glycine betaine/proline transport system substrate-binding protein
MKKRHLTGVLALTTVAALTLVGCASGTSDAAGDKPPGNDKGTITLGFLPGWTDGLSTAYLLQDQLEKMGYTVKMNTLTDAGPLYTGLAKGDVDIYPSAWPEVTHKSYMDKFGDKIEDLGKYYDNAKLTFAVPAYTEIDSIEDLKGNADMFDGKIIGIEPGAGLTKQTQTKMLPEYGLTDEYDLVTSSTAAMLAELKKATDAKKDIVVTLWRPFWANSAFPVKDLKDPKGAMGQPEGLHVLGTKGFSEKNADAAAFIKKIKLTDEQYGALEGLVTSDEYKDESADAVDTWIAEYADQLDWLQK